MSDSCQLRKDANIKVFLIVECNLFSIAKVSHYFGHAPEVPSKELTQAIPNEHINAFAFTF
jgi:hypothetical protein